MGAENFSTLIIISLTALSVIVGILTILIIIKTVDLWQFLRNVRELSSSELREAVQVIKKDAGKQVEEEIRKHMSTVGASTVKSREPQQGAGQEAEE